jgi:hypothetical protein
VAHSRNSRRRLASHSWSKRVRASRGDEKRAGYLAVMVAPKTTVPDPKRVGWHRSSTVPQGNSRSPDSQDRADLLLDVVRSPHSPRGCVSSLFRFETDERDQLSTLCQASLSVSNAGYIEMAEWVCGANTRSAKLELLRTDGDVATAASDLQPPPHPLTPRPHDCRPCPGASRRGGRSETVIARG